MSDNTLLSFEKSIQPIIEGPYVPEWNKRLQSAERTILDFLFKKITGLPGPAGPKIIFKGIPFGAFYWELTHPTECGDATLDAHPEWKLFGQLKDGSDLPIDAIKDQFGAAKAIRVDPLILDLDGDGIVNTTGLKAGTYFDYDGNGFAELTGWVGQGDGLLVWDRNGNGVIDDGTELFGDNTLLANGMRAASSFAV